MKLRAESDQSVSEDCCPNCGAPAPGKFCPECGQATARQLRTVPDYLREFIRNYASRHGLLWRTLAKLLFVPGALTLEYIAGRRTRYLRPLQLYLAASVIVFGATQIYGLNLSLRLVGDHGIHLIRGAPPTAADESSIASRFTPLQLILDHVDTARVRHFASLSNDERFNFLRARRIQYISSFILLMVPVFALIMKVCYRGHRRRYAEHLIFGLHIHSFALLILLAEALLPSVLGNALSLWILGYLVAALKRVYGGSRAVALGRGAMVAMLYWASYFAGNFLLILALVQW